MRKKKPEAETGSSPDPAWSELAKLEGIASGRVDQHAAKLAQQYGALPPASPHAPKGRLNDFQHPKEPPGVADLLAQTLSTLRAALIDFERYRAKVIPRRMVTDADGKSVIEPWPEGYLDDDEACYLIKDLLLCSELSFSRRFKLFWMMKVAKGDVDRDLFATHLHDFIAAYTAPCEEAAIAAELLRRACGRPKASNADGLQEAVEQLDGKTAALVIKFVGAIVEANKSRQTTATCRSIGVLADHLLTLPERARLAQRLLNRVIAETQASGEVSPHGEAS